MTLRKFIEESNRIEGIDTPVSDEELKAYNEFLILPSIQIADMIKLVKVIEPRAVLRTLPHHNVRVGNHVPPSGGSGIPLALSGLLWRAENDKASEWDIHLEYENLHPFTDGNGRSGRALWLWMRRGNAPLGFLHQFYYQTLQGVRV